MASVLGSMVASAGVQLGQHALTEYASVQKHQQEHPNPSPPKSQSRNTTVGIYNKVEHKTEITITKNPQTTVGTSFTNGVAFGAGVAVALGVGAWAYGKLVGSQRQEERAVVVFGGGFAGFLSWDGG